MPMPNQSLKEKGKEKIIEEKSHEGGVEVEEEGKIYMWKRNKQK